MKKVVIIADRLNPPYDEGIKNIAVSFIRELSRLAPTTLVTDKGLSIVDDTVQVNLGRTFLESCLAQKLRDLAPSVIFYIPSTSITVSSILRAAVIRLFSLRSRILVLGLQARPVSRLLKILTRLIGPYGIVVLSSKMRLEMDGAVPRLEVFTPGVDLGKFTPSSPSEKLHLRSRFDISLDSYVILHVGHLKKSRNLGLILDAMKLFPCEFLVLASSTFQDETDPSLVQELESSGVRILTGSFNIEEIYKIADCYVFPVVERTGATEMPLSVLEAMAANLAVVTTPYGALPDNFPHSPRDGFFYASDAASFAKAFIAAREVNNVNTRGLVSHLSWEAVVTTLFLRLKANQPHDIT